MSKVIGKVVVADRVLTVSDLDGELFVTATAALHWQTHQRIKRLLSIQPEDVCVDDHRYGVFSVIGQSASDLRMEVAISEGADKLWQELFGDEEEVV